MINAGRTDSQIRRAIDRGLAEPQVS